MHHAVPEGGGADFAFFAVLNEKVAIGAGAVRFILQFPLDLEQFTLRVKFKGGDGGFLPFALPCFMPGIIQIGKSGDLRVKVFKRFHALLSLVYNDLANRSRRDLPNRPTKILAIAAPVGAAKNG